MTADHYTLSFPHNDILDINRPFELTPILASGEKPTVGALLIHGLLDSSFIMRDIGIHLQSLGLEVEGMLLPGHGTQPRDLLHIHYEEWIQAVDLAISQLAEKVERIFLVGFSTGGTLALHHVLQHHEKNIAGMILIAPAIRIRSPLAFASNWHRIISWAWKRAAWLHVTAEIDSVKYQSMPFNAAYQVYQLANTLQKISKPLPCPVLMVLTQDDKTISSRAALNYFQQYASPKDKCILYSRKPAQPSDPRVVMRQAAYPELSIANISHVALPVSPDNPHYGIQGDFVEASHTEDNAHHGKKIIYSTLNNAFYNFNNALYKINLVKHFYQRLTFNPDFEFLKNEISEFISHAS